MGSPDPIVRGDGVLAADAARDRRLATRKWSMLRPNLASRPSRWRGWGADPASAAAAASPFASGEFYDLRGRAAKEASKGRLGASSALARVMEPRQQCEAGDGPWGADSDCCSQLPQILGVWAGCAESLRQAGINRWRDTRGAALGPGITRKCGGRVSGIGGRLKLICFRRRQHKRLGKAGNNEGLGDTRSGSGNLGYGKSWD